MEWMSVNDMLRDEITKLDYTLIPPGFRGDTWSVRTMQESLSKVIDALGALSAEAQGLNRVITTADKLRNSPSHFLYLLKDPMAKGGKGEVIGLMKVGQKHLFLFDERARVHEVEPLCVLDMFVVRERQRHGVGRRLFDHVLQDLGARVHQLAIDGPSHKMEQFMRKNYAVERLVRQNNNFAVAPQFFDSLDDVRCAPTMHARTLTKSGRVTPEVAPAVGRFAAHKPPSAIASVIHGSVAGGGYYSDASNGASATSSPERDAGGEGEGDGDGESGESEEDGDVNLSAARPTTLLVEREPEGAAGSAVAAAAGVAGEAAGLTPSRRDSQLTDRGFFDVKFYHNKLW